jgi:pimeloyl-ACP methyl ester carboxylesterase
VSPTEPTVTRYAEPPRPRGLVLMLHGGQQHGDAVVDGRSASWQRSAAMARTISRRASANGTAVWLLRFRQRGWNDGVGPVSDARRALARARDELGEVPVVLLGHSMGARTAVHAADDDLVRGVVALAPWFPAGEPVEALVGKRLVAAHGSQDRITSPRATRAYVERARRAGVAATYVDMGPVGHYLLRRVGAWNDLAAREALGILA